MATDRAVPAWSYLCRSSIWSPCDLDLRPYAWKVRTIHAIYLPSLTHPHFSTLTSSTGHKTRHFSTIISEITSCMQIHSSHSPPSRLGGVSLEFTGELNEEGYSVTECLGGSMELKESELSLRYQTFCDPRLNFEQSLGEYMRTCCELGVELIGSAFRCCLPDIEPLQARTKWSRAC